MENKSDKAKEEKKEKKSKPVNPFISFVLFLVLLLVNVYFGHRDFTISTPFMVGAINFFGVLALANYFSGDPNLTSGEVRTAIAASLIILYFIVLSWALFGNNKNFFTGASSAAVLDNFTRLIEVVVAFYFGSRTVEEVVKTWPSRGKGTTSDVVNQNDLQSSDLGQSSMRTFFDARDQERGG